MQEHPSGIQVVLGDHARFKVDEGEITMTVTEIHRVTTNYLKLLKFINLFDSTSILQVTIML